MKKYKYIYITAIFCVKMCLNMMYEQQTRYLKWNAAIFQVLFIYYNELYLIVAL